jgi:hypothetical protein
MDMNNRGRNHKAGAKDGQQFARLTVGYLEKICCLRQNGPKAVHILSWLLIKSKGKETVKISYRQLVELTGLSLPSVQNAISDLVGLNLIEVGKSVNQQGNASNLYRIVPPSPIQKSYTECTNNLHGVTKNLIHPVQKSCTPIRIDKTVDSIDNIDGNNSSEKTCFEEIIEALSVIGVGKNRQYKLAVKIHDAGLTDEDVANAGKQAAMKVLKGQTRNSEGLDFTRGLSKTALESIGAYAIGIIENSLELELPEIAGPEESQ